MKIAIDINGITARSGLANYLRLLVPALAAEDRENDYLLYLHSWTPPELPPGLLKDAPNFSLAAQRLPQKAELLGERVLGLRLAEPFLLRRGVDVFHGPSNVLPRLSRIPSVLTLHHYMSPAHPLFSKHLGLAERFYFRQTDASLEEAAHVITDSDYTRGEVLNRFGLPPDRLTTICPGPAEPAPAPAPARMDEILSSYGLGRGYFLFVGPINERKNLPRLLEAFALALKERPGLKLAVAGDGDPAYMARVKRNAAELGLGAAVAFTGRTGPEQAAALYAGALALCYPSLFEGFGYPPLEAMAAGCPVLASRAASIPEVVGGAGLLFDPENPAEMAGAMLKLAGDPAAREALIAAGRARLPFFSWSKVARETIAIYRKAYAARK